jgi:ABC-type lipoprotein export system ATPase subunit
MVALPRLKPLVEVRCAGRDFGRAGGRVHALKPATCRVLPGERIALVGPSGSGKSTLLHLMAGLDGPTTGNIAWPALGASDALRPAKLAFIPQTPSLIASLNVVENVELPLLLAGGAGGERAAALVALDQLGLAGLAERLPEELSGGQAQRVAVARAMAGNPQLLLADEPTGQLDQANASALLDALLAFTAKHDMALVVATHDARVAARLDKVWHMTHGLLEVSVLDAPALVRSTP